MALTSTFHNVAIVVAVAAGISSASVYAQATDKAIAAPKNSISSSDVKWVEKAARAGIAEVEAGKLAAAQGKRDDIRAFGKQMIADHGKANDELKGIATQKGVTVPDKTDSKHVKALTKLSGLSGDKFDKQYLKTAGVDDHTDAQKLFKDGANDLKDPDLKAFAQKTLPTVEHHLQMVKDMKK
jgi:putative membrane protein